MSSPSLVKLGPRTTENCWAEMPTPKIARRKRAKFSTTQRWIIQFSSNFVQSLHADTQNALKFQCKEVKVQGHTVTVRINIKRYN